MSLKYPKGHVVVHTSLKTKLFGAPEHVRHFVALSSQCKQLLLQGEHLGPAVSYQVPFGQVSKHPILFECSVLVIGLYCMKAPGLHWLQSWLAVPVVSHSLHFAKQGSQILRVVFL